MAATDASGLVHQGTSVLDRVQRMLHAYPVISPAVVLLLSFAVFTLTGEGRFGRPETIGLMLQQTAVLATLAIGQTLIILTAGIDLAVGTAMILVHLVMAKSVVDGLPVVGTVHPITALLVGIALGMLLGAIHGGLVTRLALPPFIVTLGTFYVFQSLGLVYSEAQTFSADGIGRDSLLLFTGEPISLGPVPITVGVIFAIVLYAAVAFVLNNTAWGRHVYAVGDDAEAARLAGIKVTRVLMSVYIVAGAFYALGGWVQIGRSLSASVNAATDANLASITAVVIGGTSLFGGRGRIFGTLIGALIVTVFRVGLSLAGVDVFYVNLAIGSLILVAVGLDQWIRKVGG